RPELEKDVVRTVRVRAPLRELRHQQEFSLEERKEELERPPPATHELKAFLHFPRCRPDEEALVPRTVGLARLHGGEDLREPRERRLHMRDRRRRKEKDERDERRQRQCGHLHDAKVLPPEKRRPHREKRRREPHV